MEDKLKSQPNIKPIQLKGAGAFGYVFLGKDLHSNEKLAVKRVKKAQRYVSREYEVLLKLNGCEKIVQLMDIFYTKNKRGCLMQNFVMEYVHESLENTLMKYRKKNLHIPILKIKHFMFQILEGIAYAHSQNICHRDLKPDNILVDEKENIKICDFGSAKVLLDNKNIPHITSRYYRPPELIFCIQDYSTSIDMWPIGCIFAEMFLLEPLFSCDIDGNLFGEQVSFLGYPSQRARNILFHHLQKHQIEELKIFSNIKSQSFAEIIHSINSEYKIEDCLVAEDLLRKFLAWIPVERITAKDSLNHPFFSNK